MAVRSAMHQAGAAALRQLLRFSEPPAEENLIACACGQQARYRELRTRPILTAVGWAEVTRPYYLCPHCHNGQFPADAELDIENTEFSPGVRRMNALVRQAAPFGHGRAQVKLLAGLEVTAKRWNVPPGPLERISRHANTNKLAAIPLAKAFDMSTLTSVTAAGSPPCTCRSAAKAATVEASLPGVTNTTLRSGRSTNRETYFWPRREAVSSMPTRVIPAWSALARAAFT
jgi:hypothetical protein